MLGIYWTKWIIFEILTYMILADIFTTIDKYFIELDKMCLINKWIKWIIFNIFNILIKVNNIWYTNLVKLFWHVLTLGNNIRSIDLGECIWCICVNENHLIQCNPVSSYSSGVGKKVWEKACFHYFMSLLIIILYK